MTTPAIITEAETAAIPTAIAIVQALRTFNSSLGSDPAVAVARLPGALQVLAGTIEMQFPSLASAELGQAQSEADTKLLGLVTKLEAHLPGAAPPAAA